MRASLDLGGYLKPVGSLWAAAVIITYILTGKLIIAAWVLCLFPFAVIVLSAVVYWGFLVILIYFK